MKYLWGEGSKWMVVFGGSKIGPDSYFPNSSTGREEWRGMENSILQNIFGFTPSLIDA